MYVIIPLLQTCINMLGALYAQNTGKICVLVASLTLSRGLMLSNVVSKGKVNGSNQRHSQ